MDINDQLSALFAAALEQQEAAKEAVADLTQERKALAAAVEAIKNASSSLQSATGSAASLAASGHQQERQKTFFPESQGIVARHLLFNGCKGLRRSKGRSCNSGRFHHKGTFLNKDMAIQHKSLVI